MSDLPDDVAAQALDAIGSEYVLGTLRDGDREAQVLLRAYGQCRRQLLRGANWNFARRTAHLLLLADASGLTPNVGTEVPIPWRYEYAYPNDCVKVRFVPRNRRSTDAGVPPGNISIPQNKPLMTGLGAAPLYGERILPAPWVEATDPNYAGSPGQEPTPGVAPVARTVILTNEPNAQCVYTSDMIYPSTWDPLFRAAMVAYLASEVALALTKDKALGRAIRNDQIAIAKDKLEKARAIDGNEAFTSSDIPVDWMNARRSGAMWSGYGGPFHGGFGGHVGYDTVGFADGSCY